MSSPSGYIIPAPPNGHFYNKQPNMKRRPTIEKITPGVDIIKNTEMLINNKGETIRYPRVKQFAHFHYDHVEFDTIQSAIDPDNDDDDLYAISVCVNKKMWMVHRGYEHIKVLDKQLHSCVYDRKFSQLPDLNQLIPDSIEHMSKIVGDYLVRFTDLSAGHPLNCGTVLNFFEVDNKGNRLVGTDESAAINIPAIAAAQTIKAYTSQAPDELSLQVGDMVSVIDKPRPEESTWWRGKKRFEVGFFPSECVEIIGVKIPASHPSGQAETKPVLAKRGKLITFLRMFFSNRPQRSTLKQNGIVKERVYGCDLGEHLSNSSLNVPHVLTSCCNAIELHGLIDGIYRLTGVASNIQKLRAEFDDGSIKSLMEEEIRLDMHTITAVLKMYFRELPNPLLTYQLYNNFSDAVSLKGDERLLKIKSSIVRLPPPHYRTAKSLFAHLNRMSLYSSKTGMDSRNLAIVWSPNLMRSKSMETGNVNGAQMLHFVSVQATIVEALISNYEYIFSDDEPIFRADVNTKKPRPSSVAVSTPSRLITLTEAQDRLQETSSHLGDERSSSYTGGEDSSDIIPVFHTVIDFEKKPMRDSGGSSRDSGGGSSAYVPPGSIHLHGRDKSPSRWRALFNRSRPSSLKNKKTEDDTDNRPHSYPHLDPQSDPQSGPKSDPSVTNASVYPSVVSDERTQSVDSRSNDITDNEIGHLSRRSDRSSSSTNVHLGRISGSFSDLPLMTNNEYGLRRASSGGGAEDESLGLAKSASHESFFEPPLIESESGDDSSSSPLPPAAVLLRPAAAADPLENLTYGVTKTPGVVVRPAYKNPIGDLFSQPKAVWKGTTNKAKQMANSSTDLVQSQTSLYHSLQSPQNPPLHNTQQYPFKQPYLSPPLSGHITEEMQPLSLTQSPGALRKPVRCFTNTHPDPPPLSYTEEQEEEEENVYETIGPPRSAPPPNKATDNTDSQTNQSGALLKTTNINTDSDPAVTIQDTSAHKLDSAQSHKLDSSQSDKLDSSVLRDSELTEMERLQLGWNDSDMLQFMNQAKQARISRSFSIQTGSSDRSRRTFSDSGSVTVNQNINTGTQRSNLYANIDSLGVKEPEIIPSHLSKTLSAPDPVSNITIPPSIPPNSEVVSDQRPIQCDTKPPMSPKVVSAAPKFSDLYQQNKTRQNSVPKSYYKTKIDTSEESDGRPRSNSIPYKVSPANIRRVNIDVDTAIANAPDVSHILNKAPRKPSRKMEYVNKNSYEPDTRRKMAATSAAQYYDCESAGSDVSGYQLSQSYHSSTASSSSSRGSSVDVAVFRTNTPPVTENVKPRPPSPTSRLSIHLKDHTNTTNTNTDILYENLPLPDSSVKQSEQKQSTRPHRLGSSDPDSSEERGTRPVPMSRRKTPPQTAPRRNVDPQASQVSSSDEVSDEKPNVEEHHSRLIISYSKPSPEHTE